MKKLPHTDQGKLQAANQNKQSEEAISDHNQAHPLSTKISAHEQDRAFDNTLAQARTHMNWAERTFSHIIHIKSVEQISDTLGGTLARPNTILYGSLAALTLTLATYLTAKYFGYALSGAESIVAFIIGWVIGAIIDYTHVLIRGGRAKNTR